MLKILPLVQPSHIQVQWDFRRFYPGDPIAVRATYNAVAQVSVSDFEYTRGAITRNDVEERARAEMMLRFYPKELIRELREIQRDLAMRAPYPGRDGCDPLSDIQERLAVVTAQLASVK